MERVAFLVEPTGERISCLLNPELLETRRELGVRVRRAAGGFLASEARTDYPLIATGGGVTELDLQLLFDTEVAQAELGPDAAAAAPGDVRELTRPIWDLTENAAADGFAAPPSVRFIWGKAWNVPGVIVAVAERLERFDADGAPRRSWLSLRLRRVDEPDPRPTPPLPVTPQFEPPDAASDDDGGQFQSIVPPVDDDGVPGLHLFQMCADAYGQPDLAPDLGAFNGLADLLDFDEGTVIQLPPLSALRGAS